MSHVMLSSLPWLYSQTCPSSMALQRTPSSPSRKELKLHGCRTQKTTMLVAAVLRCCTVAVPCPTSCAPLQWSLHERCKPYQILDQSSSGSKYLSRDCAFIKYNIGQILFFFFFSRETLRFLNLQTIFLFFYLLSEIHSIFFYFF